MHSELSSYPARYSVVVAIDLFLPAGPHDIAADPAELVGDHANSPHQW
jgi:hypothetical protein